MGQKFTMQSARKRVMAFMLPIILAIVGSGPIWIKVLLHRANSDFLEEKIKDSEKLKFISNEHSILKDQLDKNIKTDGKLEELFQSLKEINAKLWVIEDDKRQCEKDKDFGEKFIRLSRDVHFLNDDRAKIKLEINNITGSKIKEIKEYTSY